MAPARPAVVGRPNGPWPVTRHWLNGMLIRLVTKLFTPGSMQTYGRRSVRELVDQRPVAREIVATSFEFNGG